MKPSNQIPRTFDNLGKWQLPRRLGDNIIDRTSDNHDKYWACNGTRIQQVQPASVPTQQLHRTISVYHFGGDLYLVNFDATTNPVGPSSSRGYPSTTDWQRMRFDHHSNGMSFAKSYGANDRLYRQRQNQSWAPILLPQGYWAYPENTTSNTVGGMGGYIGLMLAMIMYGYQQGQTQAILGTVFQNGQWNLNTSQVRPCMCVFVRVRMPLLTRTSSQGLSRFRD